MSTTTVLTTYFALKRSFSTVIGRFNRGSITGRNVIPYVTRYGAVYSRILQNMHMVVLLATVKRPVNTPFTDRIIRPGPGQ